MSTSRAGHRPRADDRAARDRSNDPFPFHSYRRPVTDSDNWLRGTTRPLETRSAAPARRSPAPAHTQMSVGELNAKMRDDPIGCMQAMVTVLARNHDIRIVWDDGQRAVAWPPANEIRSPRIRSAQDAAIAAHEIAHVALRHRSSCSWFDEMEACEWTLSAWRQLQLPQYDEALYRMQVGLRSYISDALLSGETTPTEVLNVVERELLGPFARDLEVRERAAIAR
jgi:hypothetical protein